MRWHPSLRSFFLVFSCTRLVSCLFEDEEGQYEWFVQQLGKPTALAFAADSPDRFFATSASGVVASILLKDGTIQWRRVAADSNIRLLRSAGQGLVTVTDSGIVQAWRGSNGDLSWQREISDPVVDLSVPGTGNKQSVIVVRESQVDALSLAGKEEWSVGADKLEHKVRFLAASTADGDLNVCALAAASDGSNAQAIRLEVASGKILSKDLLSKEVGKGLRRGAFMIVDAFLVILIDNKLSAYSLCDSKVKVEPVDLSQVKSDSKSTWRLQPWQRTRGVFAATDGSTTTVFGIAAKGLKQLRSLDGVAIVGPVFGVHDDETGQPVALSVVKEEGTQIQLMDPASGNVQPAVHVAGFTAADHGEGKLLLVNELPSGEHRAIISAADHSLAGIQSAKVDWIREEALASIQQATFYSRHSQVRSRSAEDEGLVAQVAQLPLHAAELLKAPLEVASYLSKLFMTQRSPPKTGLGIMPNAKVPSNYEELRGFGADKLILAVTSASKVFALEATTSEIVWSKYLGPSDSKCQAVTSKNSTRFDRCSPWMQLLPSSAAVYPELVVVPPASSSTSQGVFWIEPLTGKLLHTESMPADAEIVSVLPLQRKGKKGEQVKPILPLLLIDNKNALYVLPEDSPELQESAGNVFHYEVDSVKQVVQGFAIDRAESGGVSKHLVPLWNLELASLGEKILAIATPEHREWDHVPVHIKGDATILFKYINPNLLSLVSEDPKGNLNLYALDAVTGHVLHQSLIAGGTAPVHMVACDNWVVVHYRNAKRTRFEILVTEFFQPRSDDGPWEILFPGKQANHTKSAHQLEMPVPLQQTYIFPAGVTSMGVSATLKGITPRSILMALKTDHIFRISKDMLNPRRPFAPGTAPEDIKPLAKQFAPTKDEPLMPYASVIPLKPTEVMNYYHALGKVTGIVSSPTALESTSLVFSFGLDLFFMPVQTAKAYDVLSPGFNYILLYGSVGSVVLVFVVTSVWAQRRALQERWK